MPYFKWHPLFECQHIPQRTEEERKLQERVLKLKEEGQKKKKEKEKQRKKFQFPYYDQLTNTHCTKAYADYKYIGALTHLRTCAFRHGPGNEKRLQEYLK